MLGEPSPRLLGRQRQRPLDRAAAAAKPPPLPPLGPLLTNHQLAAAIDNRAGEVGLAILDAARGKLLLAQHVETSRTFPRTL